MLPNTWNTDQLCKYYAWCIYLINKDVAFLILYLLRRHIILRSIDRRGSWLTSLIIYLIFFTHAVPRTKVGSSRLTSLFIYLTCFTCVAPRTKKQGAPNWRPFLSIWCFSHVQRRIQKARGSWLTSLIIYLMLFTCAVPCTKRKGLPIDIPYWLSNTFYPCNVNRSWLMYHHTFHIH
jgi:hypothetical protein